MRRMSRGVAVIFLLVALPQVAAALPLLSEVFYDAVGSDDGQSFVELYGAPGTSLVDWKIEGVNGSNGDVTHSLVLSGEIPEDGIFVVADGLSDGTTLVGGADLILSFDFQNGPDSIRLLRPDASVADALGYGEFGPGEFFAGEGSAAPDAPADSSLARAFANVDTDDNAVDFVVALPTPGSAPLAVPEPSTALLLGTGLVALARAGRRRA